MKKYTILILTVINLSSQSYGANDTIDCEPNLNADLTTVFRINSEPQICEHQSEILSSYQAAFQDAIALKISIPSFIAFDTTLGLINHCSSGTIFPFTADYCDLREANFKQLLETFKASKFKSLLIAQKNTVTQLCGD